MTTLARRVLTLRNLVGAIIVILVAAGAMSLAGAIGRASVPDYTTPTPTPVTAPAGDGPCTDLARAYVTAVSNGDTAAAQSAAATAVQDGCPWATLPAERTAP